MFIATVIADALDPGAPDTVARALAGIGAVAEEACWINEGVAFDLPFARAMPNEARAAIEGLIVGADVVVQPVAHRRKTLLVADMDSTMITVECIDELADYAGIKAEIAAVTEAAMRGELEFEAALDARVALLKGMDAGVLERCYAERVRLMPGATTLIRTMRAHGGRCVLVSGGFTHFADRVAAEIGFDRAVSNTLEIADGRLTGTVARPIVGAAAKLETLRAEADALGIVLEQTIAIGDGANDLPMIEAAGLGVAYHAKPKVAAAAAARIAHGDLSTLLYAQGYPRSAWID